METDMAKLAIIGTVEVVDETRICLSFGVQI
jgi:hypothetical protein